MLQVLCQCIDMSLCCWSCVSVLTCLCVAGPVSVCWSSKPAGGSGQVPVSGQNAVHSLPPLLPHSSPPVPMVTSPCCCTSVVHSGAWVVCYEPADSVVAMLCSRCWTIYDNDGRFVRSAAGPVSVPCKD